MLKALPFFFCKTCAKVIAGRVFKVYVLMGDVEVPTEDDRLGVFKSFEVSKQARIPLCMAVAQAAEV